MRNLIPDYYASDYGVINSEWLSNHNYRYIFSDLDDTLVAHRDIGDEKLDAWLTKLNEAGITFIGTSNNDNRRAQRFRDQHGVKVIEDSHKPRRKVIQDYIDTHNIDKDQVIFMGDQLLVDIFCGNRLGLDTVLVKPINSNTPISVQFTWLLDHLLLKFLRLR